MIKSFRTSGDVNESLKGLKIDDNQIINICKNDDCAEKTIYYKEGTPAYLPPINTVMTILDSMKNNVLESIDLCKNDIDLAVYDMLKLKCTNRIDLAISDIAIEYAQYMKDNGHMESK